MSAVMAGSVVKRPARASVHPYKGVITVVFSSEVLTNIPLSKCEQADHFGWTGRLHRQLESVLSP